ncbi:MAG: bifunctional riboflavin kinase/FAD synthetase [Pseudomonadota bacterium]
MLVVDNTTAPVEARGAVMAIGNFDGVHRGHEQVIGQALALAGKAQAPSGVLTFEPHPRDVFRPEDPPFRLTLASAKTRQIANLGIDIHVIAPFSRDFSSQSPDQFVQQILVDGLAIRHAVVGYDFHYGHKRQGSVETLRQAAEQYGFGLTVVAEVADEGGGPLSSSAARKALQDGQPRLAAQILGRPWEIEGVVQKGDQRGRTLGYPTANLSVGRHLHPAFGIYAVEASIGTDGTSSPEWGPWLPGVANFGIRPMYKSEEPLLETYLFDFDQDIYGQTIRVRFVDHLRPEMSFPSVDELIKQIDRDAAAARAVLAKNDWQIA